MYVFEKIEIRKQNSRCIVQQPKVELVGARGGVVPSVTEPRVLSHHSSVVQYHICTIYCTTCCTIYCTIYCSTTEVPV